MLNQNQICFIAIKHLLLQSKTFYCAELVCYCNERLFIAIKYCSLQKKAIAIKYLLSQSKFVIETNYVLSHQFGVIAFNDFLLQSTYCDQILLLNPKIFIAVSFVLLKANMFYCN
jgi:hypothetical protein